MASTEITQVQPVPIERLAARAESDINVGDGERILSALGGAVLALYGLRRRSPAGFALALLGGGLVYRGVTGHCNVFEALGVNTAQDSGPGIIVKRAVTIDRSPADLYRYWHNFENLPCFMQHLESVTCISETRSHWVAKAPLGRTVEWDAEITEDEENRRISWRSIEGSQIYTAGTVSFVEAPGGRGTEVLVTLEYSPPAGIIGVAVAKLFGEEPAQQIADDLRHFKQMMEAGEIPTIEGQPSGRRQPGMKQALKRLAQPAQPEHPDEQARAEPWIPASEEPAWRNTDAETGTTPKKPVQPRKPIVEKTSEDSFPASDPPAWTTSGEEENEREVGA